MRKAMRRRRSTRSVSWKYTWTTPGSDRGRRSARPRSPSECVVGIARSSRPEGSRIRAGSAREAQRLPGCQVRRTSSTRRAVHVPELGAGFGDLEIRVPAAAAEELRLEAELAQSTTFGEHALPRSTGGRPSMVRGGPMRVVPERTAGSCFLCARDPGDLVFTRRGIGRPHQRGNREPSGPALLQSREARPDLVVEGSFDVAGDDRVPFPRRVRHQRTSIALRSGRPGRRRPYDRRARPPRP